MAAFQGTLVDPVKPPRGRSEPPIAYCQIDPCGAPSRYILEDGRQVCRRHFKLHKEGKI